MKVKAKLVIEYCSEHTKPICKCDYITGDDAYLNCEHYIEFRKECLRKGTKPG